MDVIAGWTFRSLVLLLAASAAGCGSDPVQPPPVPPPVTPPPAAPGPAPARDCRLGVELLAVVTPRSGASAIALDATNIYLRTQAGVLTIPKTGGTLAPLPANLAAPLFPPSDRAADETHEYQSDEANLLRIRLAAGSRPELLVAHGEPECFAVAVDQSHVYWTGATGVVKRTEKSRPGIPVFVGGAGASDCDDDYDGIVLAVDDTSVYWTAGEPRRRVSDEDPLMLFKTCR